MNTPQKFRVEIKCTLFAETGEVLDVHKESMKFSCSPEDLDTAENTLKYVRNEVQTLSVAAAASFKGCADTFDFEEK